jgi:hypothetical protein
MSEPKKWTEDGASQRARELLASARRPRRPSEVERARSFERVRTVAALPQAPSLGPWTAGAGAVAAVGIAAILMTTASTGTRSRQPSAFLPTTDVSIPVVPTATPPVIAAFLEPMGPPVLSGAEPSGQRSTRPPLRQRPKPSVPIRTTH